MELNENNYEIKMRASGLFTTSYKLFRNSPLGRRRIASAKLSILAYVLGYENSALQDYFSIKTGLPRPFIKRLVQRDLEGRV